MSSVQQRDPISVYKLVYRLSSLAKDRHINYLEDLLALDKEKKGRVALLDFETVMKKIDPESTRAELNLLYAEYGLTLSDYSYLEYAKFKQSMDDTGSIRDKIKTLCANITQAIKTKGITLEKYLEDLDPSARKVIGTKALQKILEGFRILVTSTELSQMTLILSQYSSDFEIPAESFKIIYMKENPSAAEAGQYVQGISAAIAGVQGKDMDKVKEVVTVLQKIKAMAMGKPLKTILEERTKPTPEGTITVQDFERALYDFFPSIKAPEMAKIIDLVTVNKVVPTDKLDAVIKQSYSYSATAVSRLVFMKIPRYWTR